MSDFSAETGSKKFYLTTPLYYVNAEPHIGHAYTTILGDVMIRFRKIFGRDSFMLTGTDEHGSKIADAAGAEGLEPKIFADKIAQKFKTAWKNLNINYDHFIRTTDDYHIRIVQKVLGTLYEKGEIGERR